MTSAMAAELPELNKNEVEEIVKLYREAVQGAPRVVSVSVQKNPSDSSHFIFSQWSQRNLERGSSLQLLRTLLSDSSFTSSVEINTVDVTHCILQARTKSGKLKAVVQAVASDDAKSKKYYLDIWTAEKLLMTFDLTALNLHGPVYADEIFSVLNWSQQEDKLVYVAEKKKPKTAPFYQQKTKTESEDDKNEELVGAQYVYEDDWGEQMSPKTHPVIAVCDIVEKNISILKGIPDDISPGQVIWEPSGAGVVGFGVYHRPRRLGVMFCTNRRSCIFFLTSDGKFSVLSDERMSVFSPKFSPDGKYLIWLQRPQGGPHHSTWALVKCDWKTKKITTVVDVVKSVTKTKNGREFFGIYSYSLPQNCWTSDSKYILLSTSQRYCVKSYAVSIDDGSVWDISSPNEDESLNILEVSADDYVVGSKSSFMLPPVLVSMHFPSAEKRSFDEVTWHCLTKPCPVDDSNIISRFAVSDNCADGGQCYAIYFGPDNKPTQSVPLILYPHGGPHASSFIAFSPIWQFFSRLGFAVLFINYRGSTGCGDDHVVSLLGNVGSVDVKDCYSALQKCLAKFACLDPKNVVLFGGSHGGFIITHLSSQYPDNFKAVAAMNPVINLASMAYTTDILDWVATESGFSYDGVSSIMRNSKLWQKMVTVSPLYDVRNVKAPTLLLLGKKDLRVPSSQGLSYYEALKELNVPTKVHYYSDDHSLSSTPVEMDVMINAAIWFRRCMARICDEAS